MGEGENCVNCEWRNMSFEIRKAAEILNNPLVSVIYFISCKYTCVLIRSITMRFSRNELYTNEHIKINFQ